MALGKRLINTGAAAVCNTDSVQAFGVENAFSSNIALYQLDGDGGVTNNVPDTTTNYNGTASNITYATGQFGNAAVFNGSSSYIDLPNLGASVSGSNARALSVWIKIDSLPTTYASIITYGSASSGQSFGIYINSSGKAQVSYYNKNLNSTTTLSLDTWYNIIGIYKGGDISTSSNTEIYINGQLETLVDGGGSVSGNANTSNSNYAIGYYKPDPDSFGGSYFDGLIDQVRIFDRQITSEEVSTLYNESTSTASNTNPLSDGSGVALYSLDYDASDAGGLFDGSPTDVDFGVDGQINYGARFNGSSSYIDLPSNSLNFLTTYSMSTWINSSNSVTGAIAANWGWPGSGAELGWLIRKMTDNKIRVTNSNGTIQNYNSTGTIPLNTWTNVVVTNTQSQIKIYINGSLDSTHSSSGFTVNAGYPMNPLIGAYKYQSTYDLKFTGSIDQVRIFSKALSSDEVEDLFEETACVYTATTTDNDFPTTNVAYYKLDNSAEDEKGSYDGTESNIEYRFGRFGQAAVFNGTSSYIQAGNPLSDIEANQSVSFWFNLNSQQTGGGVGQGGLIQLNGKFYLQYSSAISGLRVNNWKSGKTFYDTSGTTNNSERFQYGLLNNNQWYHIVFVKNGTNSDDFVLYIDGQAQSQPSGTTQSSGGFNGIQGTVLGTIGASGGTTYNYLDGKLDQVRIYSTALTSDQVSQLYNEKPEVDTSNFKTVLWNGDGSSETYVSNVGMDLETYGGLVWAKARQSQNHTLYDSVRGVGKYIASDTTSTEITSTTYGQLTSFDANGFTGSLGSNGTFSFFNSSTQDYVAWVWKGGGDAVAGSSGQATNVSYSANTEAGFSIVKFTSSSSTSAVMNYISHGLNSPVEMTIYKRLDGSADWRVQHKDLNQDGFLLLNSTNALGSPTGQTFYDNTSTVGSIGIRSNYAITRSANHIAYCFHSKSGISSIGSYTGTGTTSGNFVETGFEPSFVMVKRTDGSGQNWVMFDNKRSPTNSRTKKLAANLNSEENNTSNIGTNTQDNLDFSATGFRAVTSNNHTNILNGTYIYMAFK